MARIDWVEARLQNWARWVLTRGRGTLGYAGVDWSSMADADAGRDGYITATIPISDVEASDTHAVVQRLVSPQRAAVESYYLATGTMAERCRRLCITEASLYKRIDQAHKVMAEHWAAVKAKQDAERARVEQLQRGAPEMPVIYTR